MKPRAPNAPATADVPLRCIPTTKSQEPADGSEVVPRRFGLLMGKVYRAPSRDARAAGGGPGREQRIDGMCVAGATHSALQEVPLE